MTTMVDNSDGIAVVYPSNWPENDPEAHCTIIYLGKVDEVAFTEQDVRNAMELMQLGAPGEVPVAGPEMFGPDKDIPVVLLEPVPVLTLAKLALEAVLLTFGIENASEFKDYKPHVTVPDHDREIPTTVTLGEPVLWWGPQ